MFKGVWLPCELYGFNRKQRTNCHVIDVRCSPLKWWFMKKKIEKPSKACFKIWNEFLKWMDK